VLYLSTVAAHLAAWSVLGDASFFALLTMLIGTLARRFVNRRDLPPPNFVLAACGLLCGAVGAGLTALATYFIEWPRLNYFGTLLLSQGFTLLPLLGVGVFLFPRFFGMSSDSEIDESTEPSHRRKRKGVFAALAAVVLVGSFAVESTGLIREGSALRFVATAVFIITQMPAVLKFQRAPRLGQCIRLSVWLLLLGLLWPVLLPTYRVAGLHFVFIGGLMLAVFTVATRVILGHSGQLQLCLRPLPFFNATTVLLLIGLATRVGADFMPTVPGRNIHLIYAAFLCIAAALLWGIRLVPRVLVPDPDE
jgi:hypothetical protein